MANFNTAENERFSTVLNSIGISRPVVNLGQSEANYSVSFDNIFRRIMKEDEVMIAGSRSEGLGFCYGHQSQSSSDTDVIVIATRFKVHDRKFDDRTEMEIKLSHDFHVFKVSESEHPGYVRLRILQIGDTQFENFCSYQYGKAFLNSRLVKEKSAQTYGKFINGTTVHGPAVTADLHPETMSELAKYFKDLGHPMGLNEAKLLEKSEYGVESTDFVFCLRAETWPQDAEEWGHRRRHTNWPSKSMIEDIKHTGYILAGVGSKESKDSEFQWRISFNIGEQILIESFNETQIHCLALLKMLKTELISKIGGKTITTYTLKTLMFWCLEEIPNQKWNQSNLSQCLCYCITKLKSSLENRFLPNYFIRERNMFISSELTSEVQTKLIQCLDDILNNLKDRLYSLSLITRNAIKPEGEIGKTPRQALVENWLNARITMAQQYHLTGIHTVSVLLYSGFNTLDIFQRCTDAAKKITEKNLKYAKPFIKLLHNCMGVLLYTNINTESTIRTSKSYKEYLMLGKGADKTNTALRAATCFLNEGLMEETFEIIQNIMNQDTELMLADYSKFLQMLFDSVLSSIQNMNPEIKERFLQVYEKVINKDLQTNDPYQTLAAFREESCEEYFYSLYELAWEKCLMDVTFMPAEMPILPKPVALEVSVKSKYKRACFHPISYVLLLKFLWHVKNKSPTEDKEAVISKMKSFFQRLPERQQYSSYNFLTYCLLHQGNYREATSYMLLSFEMNPHRENVAYQYIRYIAKLLFSCCEPGQTVLYCRTLTEL